MLTADDVIRRRQGQIFDRVQDIELELRSLRQRISELELEKEALIMEHDILEQHHDRGQVSVTTTTVTIQHGKRARDRLQFEDALRKLFDHVGRPMRVSEILAGLESFGFVWSNYRTAYSYLTNTPILEKVPQTRGYFQIRR